MPITERRGGRYQVGEFGIEHDSVRSIIERAKKHGYVGPFWIYWREDPNKGSRFELTDGHIRHLAWCVVSIDDWAAGPPIQFKWEASNLLCLL